MSLVVRKCSVKKIGVGGGSVPLKKVSLKPTGVKDSDTDLMVPGICHRTLVDFIVAKNFTGLKTFLETRHVNIEDRDDDGNTPLHVACKYGYREAVSLLLRHNADVKAEDNEKCTPLHVSAREGHVQICVDLLDADGGINDTDIGQWTPFMWACYYGHTETAAALIHRGCDIHLRGQQQVAALNWAAGRGHTELVKLLLDNNVKADLGDKYGTTALIWAARKGYEDIVQALLKNGASVDSVGIYSWTPLLVATKGNYIRIVDMIMEKNPNVNKVDKEGFTALAWACKEGHQEIAFKLLSSGAYVNLQDKFGDTNLIHATKGGHKAIVEALVKKYADVNLKGKDNNTCLHWAIDKNHPSIVKIILNANPDLEIHNIYGDTPLLRAVRCRNAEVVQMLLDKKAKISATDKKLDTALHIAMRARSKAIVEILLRNPKHSHLLYRPNRAGETPYNIDIASQKTILGQVFGARKLNTNEDGENILGYDLYSSSLSDILTEPSLSMPITVGLYAKWGSGKSFLLRKLREEMKSFTREWIGPRFQASPLLFVVILHIAAILGVLTLLIVYSTSSLGPSSGFVGLGVSLSVILFSYVFLLAVRQGSYRFDWYSFNVYLTSKFNSLKLVLQVMFCHPPGPEFINSTSDVQPLRLLFTDQTKGKLNCSLLGQESPNIELLLLVTAKVHKNHILITSAGGQNSVTQMIGSLYDSIEIQYGKFASRLFRAFRPAPVKNSSRERWRRLCCIPYVFIYMTCFLFFLVGVVLIVIQLKYHNMKKVKVPLTSSVKRPLVTREADDFTEEYDQDDDDDDNSIINHLIDKGTSLDIPIGVPMKDDIQETWILSILITLSVIILVVIVANIYTIGRCIQALFFSQRQHLQRAVAKLDLVKSEGYLQAVKGEVQLLLQMVGCLDAFTGQQSRLVVFVDGLDSCEQAKVLSVLDAVHMLFSDQGSPFIIILAIDPHVITKAIELNLNSAFSDTSIGGNAYLRNIVHLPFFLQNSGLRKVKISQKVAMNLKHKLGSTWPDETFGERRNSSESVTGGKKTTKHSFKSRPRASESIGSSFGSRVNVMSGEPSDLTKILLTDDYFSDVNPRSLRRLMNVIYVMGRLLKAFHIDFNWYRIASWVNITEQWPYRTSWIIYFSEQNEDLLDDSISLKHLYDKIKTIIPTQKELEPLLEMDRDEKKFESFLNLHKKNLTVTDIKIFLPFSINLDPYLKKIIREEISNMQELGIDITSILTTNKANTPSNTSALTRRQVTELSRKMSYSEMNQLGGGATNVYTPYGKFMPSYPPPPPTSQSIYDPYKQIEKSPSLIQLPLHLSDQVLSIKTVEGVCDLLQSIPGITVSKVDYYCSNIVNQNLTGQVLRTCDLNELKTVMNMNFGDWELFRNIIQAMRSNEKKNKNVSFSIGGEETFLSAQKIPSRKPSTSERQVTMEDATISGMLSTLNEEAHEDITAREILSHHGSREEIHTPNDSLSGEDQDISNMKREIISSECEDEAEVLYLSHISPSPSFRENQGDLERGNSSRYSSMSHILSSSTWQRSQLDMKGMTSVPTSPTEETKPLKSKHSHSRFLPSRLRTSLRRRAESLNVDDPSAYPRAQEEEDPYAWLSQTAPSSPSHRRKEQQVYLPEDEVSTQIKKSILTGFETLGENRMRKDKGAITKGGEKKKSSSILSRLISPSESDDEDDCPSPEQVTVSKRPTEYSRGPPLQEIFVQKNDQVLTAILPDGKNLTMNNPEEK